MIIMICLDCSTSLVKFQPNIFFLRRTTLHMTTFNTFDIVNRENLIASVALTFLFGSSNCFSLIERRGLFQRNLRALHKRFWILVKNFYLLTWVLSVIHWELDDVFVLWVEVRMHLFLIRVRDAFPLRMRLIWDFHSRRFRSNF